jgi:hypothetical protein
MCNYFCFHKFDKKSNHLWPSSNPSALIGSWTGLVVRQLMSSLATNDSKLLSYYYYYYYFFILFFCPHKKLDERFELVTSASWDVVLSRLSYPLGTNYYHFCASKIVYKKTITKLLKQITWIVDFCIKYHMFS